MHDAWLAFSLALDKAGKSIAARIAMMAITTSNSISVNARPDASIPAWQSSPCRVGVGFVFINFFRYASPCHGHSQSHPARSSLTTLLRPLNLHFQILE